MKRPALAVLLAAVLTLAGNGCASSSQPSSERSGSQLKALLHGQADWRSHFAAHAVTGSLANVLRSAAVVNLSAFRAKSSFTVARDQFQNAVYGLSIESIDFIATHAFSTGEVIPPIRAGESIDVFEPLGPGAEGLPSSLDGVAQPAPTARVIAILTWHQDTDQVATAKTPWALKAVATVANGNLTFVGPFGDNENATLSRVRASDAGSKFDNTEGLLVAWAQEVESNDAKTKGPLTEAAFHTDTPDPVAAWFALPLESRPLDSDQTPASVLATLDLHALLIDIDPAVVDKNILVRVVTSQGVSYGGTLEGSYRYAQIYTPTDGEWKLEVCNFDLATFRITNVIRSVAVAAGLWSGDVATLIQVDRSVTTGPDGPISSGNVAKVSKDEMQTWLSGHAVVGTPGPEPPDKPIPTTIAAPAPTSG